MVEGLGVKFGSINEETGFLEEEMNRELIKPFPFPFLKIHYKQNKHL